MLHIHKILLSKINIKLVIIFALISCFCGNLTHKIFGINASDYQAQKDKNLILSNELLTLEENHNLYKSKMKLYENINIEEAKKNSELEKNRIEHEETTLKNKYSADRSSIRRELAMDLIEQRGSSSTYEKISYEDLSSRSAKNFNRKVNIYGKVGNFVKTGDTFWIFVGIENNFSKPVLVAAHESQVSGSLKNKYISVNGISVALIDTSNFTASSLKIPKILADDLRY